MAQPQPTLVLSFDNLGEAAEIEQGSWPLDRTVGNHPSVTVALPFLLDLLDDLALPATFFVEAINTEHYPGALQTIAGRGYELGHHGWRHERWSDLTPEAQAVILRTAEAFGRLGIGLSGFRPPGGSLGKGSLHLIGEAGLSWCSPAGRHPWIDPATRVAAVPFSWPLVDATYLHPPFARLRARLGLSQAPLAAKEAEQCLLHQIDQAVRCESATVVLHPFLIAERAWRESVTTLLFRLARQRDEGRLRILSAGVRADELRKRFPAS
jgi:peptidoglycan/xylan/chitin deacetylase (PgdA/CDA1 family)